MILSPAPELAAALAYLEPGKALDLACGHGRHTRWLTSRGWSVTSVDRDPLLPETADIVIADLEKHGFPVRPEAWDLIVCWLYWQEDLMPLIAAGVRPGGIVALAGKTTGSFATSLTAYRRHLPGWEELASGCNEHRVFLIARRPCA